jgi:hypothetical protein
MTTSTKIRLDRILPSSDPEDQLSPLEIEKIEEVSRTHQEFLDGVLSQIKQIIYGSQPGRWLDPVTTVFGGDASLYALYTNGGGSTTQFVEIVCPDTVQVGDWVYPSGPKVGARFQGALVDPLNPIKIPAFGVVVSKLTTTTAKVQVSGVLDGILSGLETHKVLYVGLDGRSTVTPLSAPAYIQPVALVLSPVSIVVRPVWPVLPLPSYASHLGTSDGTTNGHVSWPSTTSGLVAAPTTPGVPYYSFSRISDWADALAHPGTRASSALVNTIGAITELDVTTTLRVSFLSYQSSGGGETVIASETIACNGTNQTSTPSGFIQTIGVVLNAGRYEGTLRVSIPFSTLLSSGGYLRIVVSHESIRTGFPYSDSWEVFVDTTYPSPPIPGGLVVAEHTPNLSYLSGIRYYGLGSTFDISGQVLEAYEAMFSNQPVNVDLSQLGISGVSDLAYTDSSITPGHPPIPKWDDALSWLKTLAINVSSFSNFNAVARQRGRDPFNISGYNDSIGGIMVYTIPQTSTDVDERFDDEAYRAIPKSVWPLAPACPPVGVDKFDSTHALDMSSYMGAQVYTSELVYPSINFLTPATRRPVQQAGTDYSLLAGTREYQRPYRHDTTPATRSNVVMYIPGFDVTTIGGGSPDIQPGGSGAVNMFIQIPSVSTVWFDCGRQYFSSQFPSPESGCLVKSLSGTAGGMPTNEYWYFTFGTMSTTLTDRMIILRIEYRSTPTKRFSRILAYNWT